MPQTHSLPISASIEPLPRCLVNRERLRHLSRRPLNPPGFIRPCLASASDAPPSGPDWTHEIKYDGFRIIAYRSAEGDVRLWSRNGLDLRSHFPGIDESVSGIGRSFVMDGEAVLFLPDGRNDRHGLRNRHNSRFVTMVAFDLMMLDGDDIRRQPLVERKARLRELVSGQPLIQFSESIEGDGETIFRHVCSMGLEGIVSKRKDSIYRSGRTRSWIKTKCPSYS